jgi:hypothetical protein
MITNEEDLCAQATGCPNAGGFRSWAREQGYPFCEVWDWTSSAGDWSFFVSKDGEHWYPMFQENNYPSAGFARTIDESQEYCGTWEEVCEQVAEEERQANNAYHKSMIQ